MRPLGTILTAAVISFVFLCPGISDAGMNRTTDAKLFRLELQPDPARPVVGINAAVLTVIDARSNRPVDDAVIEVVPWMTMHGHGSPKKPAIKKNGDGKYRVENIFYTMEGDWDLMVNVVKGDARDSATFSIVNVKRR
jgi:hypothetical protein